jgi:hypothetical protein
MDNPEKQAKTESAIKYGQYRETGKDRISNQKWTIQRNWQRLNQQSKMDNPALPVSLDCPFFIADSVFASFSRLSIFDS